jgi:hypothetical protein
LDGGVKRRPPGGVPSGPALASGRARENTPDGSVERFEERLVFLGFIKKRLPA